MIILLASVFLATLGILIGGYILYNRRALAAAEAARTRLRTRTEAERVRSLLKDESVSDVPFINRVLSGLDWVGRLRTVLDRAGVTMKPAAFLLVIVVSGLAGTFLGGRMNSSLFAVILTIAGWGAPLYWLKRKQRKRILAFEQQLPDAIDMLVSAMKAGYSFQAATQFIGDEVSEPLGPEFARFYDEQRLGVDVRTALLGLQDRIDSLDLKMFVTAVIIQRETGGNLGEVLSSIAEVIRQRIAMKGQIQALVAEPKMSARFLAILPIIVFLLLSVGNPRFLQPLLTTSIGRMMLLTSGLMVAIGYAVMMKIADVDI
ncbi:MAG TPA: type II secretion system F family protein [Gemmatimonadaceae bacterium]